MSVHEPFSSLSHHRGFCSCHTRGVSMHQQTSIYHRYNHVRERFSSRCEYDELRFLLNINFSRRLQKRRAVFIDLVIGLGIPLLQILFRKSSFLRGDEYYGCLISVYRIHCIRLAFSNMDSLRAIDI